MIPARSLVMLAAVPVVLALFALFDETLLWPMLATDVVIIMVALVDGALARKPLVKVTRQARDVFSIGRRNLVTLQLRSLSRRRLEVQVNDDLFAHASAEGLPLQATLPSHGRASVSYHVVPGRRGAYALGDHFVRYASPIGLWTRQLRIEATHPVKVFPDVQAVRQYELLARQNREQSMFRATRRRGGESEFERLREYQREDEYRAIDWKATARRGKLIAREYQLESNQSLLFMLDAGRLMTAEASGMSLLDHALNATLMLSHIASQNGDRVGLLSFADKIKSYAPPASGARATQRIIHAGYRLHPEMVETDYRRA
ncbi:MAG TPA: DUF58 domain-containing protein, partial [Sorangium sp.]|nr:DUF58 domain-containing protein [Sorangium sp.]